MNHKRIQRILYARYSVIFWNSAFSHKQIEKYRDQLRAKPLYNCLGLQEFIEYTHL